MSYLSELLLALFIHTGNAALKVAENEGAPAD
jgi:hypothetical protein